MQPLVRTTITIPQNLYKLIKMKAVVKNTSVSGLVTDLIKQDISPGPVTKTKKKDPMSTLGVFKIGIKEIYKSRDELYEDHLKRKMGT